MVYVLMCNCYEKVTALAARATKGSRLAAEKTVRWVRHTINVREKEMEDEARMARERKALEEVVKTDRKSTVQKSLVDRRHIKKG